jgi:hypothetical protein
MSSSSHAFNKWAQVCIDCTNSVTNDRKMLPRLWMSDCAREWTADLALDREGTKFDCGCELD